ncbi:MAG: hypothetical protein F6J87_28285 [Spirulina sp. SIO3F2]|nr:hypothetical protein [Spirulina sp. SIO3F2]
MFNLRRLFSTSLFVTLLLGSGNAALATETQPAPQPTAGPYFYGEVAQPEQNGATYVVMERHQDQWIGAIYQPNAEFDCFVGNLKPQGLALTLQTLATQQTFTHTLTVDPTVTVASRQETELAPQILGFEAIQTLGDQEHRLLHICHQRSVESAT